MKAMILAAGRGERLRPLTDRLPKALVELGGKPLIAWHIEKLARAGIRDIVVNVSHLGAMIESRLGGGESWGVSIAYSREAIALETAGGIAMARALLGGAPFFLVNADVFCDADFSAFAARALDGRLAHLLLVPNPGFRPGGDFSFSGGMVGNEASPRYTYAGIALVAPQLLDGVPAGAKLPLGPILQQAAARQQVSGELHHGLWSDVGTAERLAVLEAAISKDRKR
ncbi:MAG: nucleotidyltransferase family protein [Betaproteobacteria bacterium]|nr:nucleotidyltransferase family protein [Betaproteobacteria bacterium]